MNIHELMMEEALREAKKAKAEDEIPVGAVVVKEGKIIGRGHNLCEINHDLSAHAEIMAMKDACNLLKNWRLNGCDIYVTLEPCPMCMGAILRAGIKTVYFGAYDDEAGAAGSACDLSDMPGYRQKVSVKSGILKEECAGVLTDFFKEKRSCR